MSLIGKCPYSGVSSLEGGSTVYDNDEGSVVCIARCTDGQVRLTDRPEVTAGRVEICSDQRWKTFYSSHWFPTNARVACIELGFRGVYACSQE